jgi:phosphatidylserine/phosphatidylglycerophosphate/cardiolipin synthase-like enzyme
MVNTRLARLAAAGVTAVLTVAGLVATAPPATAAPVKPVIDGPVFNDPLGTPAQQGAIFTQLINLIDATPAGETIRGSDFGLYDVPVADALNAAHDRGVNVKLILDDSSYTDGTVTKPNPAWDSLKDPTTGLGSNDAARSWIVVCDDKFEDNDGVDDVARGCIGTESANPGPAYNHNKFFVFSKVGPFADGTSYPKVVFQTSSNLADWDKVQVYNDSVTFVDAVVYDGYAKYHEDERRLRYSASGDNHYYWSTPTGSTYRGFFFPRADASYNNPASDSIVNALDEVSCAYTGVDGKRHQTDIRVVMLNFLDSRIQIANKLASLRAAGCWIDVVYTQPADASKNDSVRSVLTSAGIQHRKCAIPNGPGINVRVHNKFWLIDGDYNGDITPRVYTGAANWDGSSLRSSDQAFVRIASDTYHAAYLSYFYKIRDTCAARTP